MPSRPGVRECDAVAAIMAAQIHGTVDFWGDYPAALPSVPFGRKSAAPHLTWSGDRFEPGTVGYLELGGCHNRYHAALARTVCFGAPPAPLVRLAAVVGEGLEHGPRRRPRRRHLRGRWKRRGGP